MIMTADGLRKERVLIVPAPTEIGLEIIDSLRFLKEYTLVGAGVGELNSAALMLGEYVTLPMVDDPGFVEEVQALVRARDIDFIFPAHDDVILKLSRARDTLGAVLVAPPARAVEICSFKSETYRHLADKVPTPVLFDVQDVDEDAFPVFMKPDRGQGSRGAMRVDSPEALRAVTSEARDFVLCELLPGAEYTIDCFSSAAQGLQFCAGRRRSRIVNGVAVASEIVNDAKFAEIAASIQETLGMTGAWFFQLKQARDGTLKLLEVGPRIAGTMALNRARGANFAALSLLEAKGVPAQVVVSDKPVRIIRNLTNRFEMDAEFEHLFIDYDDTVLIGDMVNPVAVAVIVRCLNEGKSVHLLSRHANDLHADLKRRRLLQLFDTVEHLTKDQKKSDYIFSQSAIFVDDSFRERQEVSDALGLLCFDVSQLPLLLKA